MIKAEDIKGPESLERWLTEWPASQRMDEAEARQVAVQIAHRAAMRVLPIAWADFLFSKAGKVIAEKELLQLLRLHLSIFVWSQFQSRVHKDRPIELAISLQHTLMGALDNRSYVKSAIHSAIIISDIVSEVSANWIKSVSAAVTDARNAVLGCVSNSSPEADLQRSNEFWRVLAQDCDNLESKRSLAKISLWPNEEMPPINSLWSDLVGFEFDAEIWLFWRKFYQNYLDGETQFTDLLLKIAEIPDEDWEAGPERVAGVIAGIESTFRIDEIIANNPLGQRIVRSDTTGDLSSQPIEKRDLSGIVKDIQRSLREFNANCKKSRGNIGLALVDAYAPHIDELRKRLSRHKVNPRELLRSIEEAHRAFLLVAKAEAATEHVQVDRLLAGLQDRAADVGVAAPEVMEEIKKRRAVKVQLMTDQQIALAVRMSAGMAADSRGLLQAALSRALLIVANEEATDDEKAGAWTFLLGAIPRGAKLKRESGEVGTDASKETSVLDTIVSYADKANKLDKGVDALQEGITEGGPWVTDAFTQVYSGNFWGLF